MPRKLIPILLLMVFCGRIFADDLSVPQDQAERQIFLAKLVKERSQNVVALIAAVTASRERVPVQGDVRWDSIVALGDLRAAEATDPLLDHIDLNFFRVPSVRDTFKDRIAIEALVKIGKPASRGAVERLATETKKKRAAMYLRVIALVEGIDLGKEMVRLAAEKEKDAEKKSRLKEALDLFKDADKVIH